MAFAYELSVFQETNVIDTPLWNPKFDKYFNIKLEFNHVLELCYPENMYIPYHTINQSYLIPRNIILLDHNDCSRFIDSMFSSTGLPPDFIQSIISDHVFSHGWSMERDPTNQNRRILTMVINILVATPYDDHQEIDRAISESLSDLARFPIKPTGEDAIQKLEKMRYSDDHGQCMCTICLEQLSIDVETMRMPCGHLYHGECIVKWLETSHTCPVCRYQM